MFQHHLSTLMFRGLDIFALHGDNEKKNRNGLGHNLMHTQKILDTLLISNINPWFKTKFWKFLPFLKFAASVVLYEFNEITINTNSTQITFATGKIIIISFGSDYTVYMYLVSWNSCDPNNVCSKSKYSLNCVLKMYYNCWDNTIFTFIFLRCQYKYWICLIHFIFCCFIDTLLGQFLFQSVRHTLTFITSHLGVRVGILITS